MSDPKHTAKVLRILSSQDVAIKSQVKVILLMLFEQYRNTPGVKDDDLGTNLATITDRLRTDLNEYLLIPDK